MGLFNRTRGRGRPKKADSLTQKERILTYRQRKAAHDELMKIAQNDPRVRVQMIRDVFHINIPDEEDSISKKKRHIEELATDEAFKIISEDPAMKNRLAMGMANRILGKMGSPDEDEENGILSSGDDIEGIIDRYHTLKDEFGGGNNGNGGLIKSVLDSEFGKQLAMIMAGMMTKGGSLITQQQERTYVVQIDGQMCEVPESQYRQILQEGRVKPVAALEQPKPQSEPKSPTTQVIVPQTQQPVIQDLELPAFFKSLDIGEIAGYLEFQPQDLIFQLKSEEASRPEVSLLLQVLSQVDYDSIVKKIKPYENHSQVGVYVKRLLSPEGRKWLEAVISLTKDGGSNDAGNSY